MILDFKNLDLIPQLLEEIKNLKSLLEPPILDLTKRKDVKKFLNISDSTISRYINLGVFKKGVHYEKEIKGKRIKILFVESAIINFKELKK